MKIKKLIKELLPVIDTMSEECAEYFLSETLPIILDGAEHFSVMMLTTNESAASCGLICSDMELEIIDAVILASEKFYVLDVNKGGVIPVVGEKPMGGTVLAILDNTEKAKDKECPEEIRIRNGSKSKNTSPLEDLSSEQLEKAFEFLELMERMLSHD